MAFSLTKIVNEHLNLNCTYVNFLSVACTGERGETMEKDYN